MPKFKFFELNAILFYSGIYCKPLTHREDQDRHIPQKINEFASLAKPRFPPNCIEDSFKAIRSTVRSPEMYSKKNLYLFGHPRAT